MEIGVQTCGHKNNPQKHAIKGKRMKAYSGRDKASTGKVGVIKERVKRVSASQKGKPKEYFV